MCQVWGPTPVITSCVGVASWDCPSWHLVLPACGACCLANLAAGQSSISSRTALRELSPLSGKNHWNPDKETKGPPPQRSCQTLRPFMSNDTCHPESCAAGTSSMIYSRQTLPAQNPCKHSAAATQGENHILFYISLSKQKQNSNCPIQLIQEIQWITLPQFLFLSSNVSILGLKW